MMRRTCAAECESDGSSCILLIILGGVLGVGWELVNSVDCKSISGDGSSLLFSKRYLTISGSHRFAPSLDLDAFCPCDAVGSVNILAMGFKRR